MTSGRLTGRVGRIILYRWALMLRRRSKLMSSLFLLVVGLVGTVSKRADKPRKLSIKSGETISISVREKS